MCVATASAGILAGALSIGSTVMGFVGQQQAAQAQMDHQARLAAARNKQIEQNNKLTIRSLNDQNRAINARTRQEQEASSQRAQGIQTEVSQRKGRAQVGAGESGVTGVSRDLLMAEFDRAQSEHLAGLERQQRFQSQSVFFQQQGLQAQAEGRLQSIQPYVPTPVNFPSPFAAALNIGSGALYGYDRHMFYNGEGPYNPQPTPSSAAQTFADNQDTINQGLQAFTQYGI